MFHVSMQLYIVPARQRYLSIRHCKMFYMNVKKIQVIFFENTADGKHHPVIYMKRYKIYEV